VATKTADDRLATLREQLHDLELRDRLDEVRERAEHAREDVRERAEHVRDDVLERVPELLDDLEPAKRKAQLTGWSLFRRVVGILLVLPRVLVRVLGALPGVVEAAAGRGQDLAERTREAAGAVPSVKRLRRRRRTQLAAWTAGGFALGVLTGWLLGRRTSPAPVYEATQGDTAEWSVPPVDGATPTAPDAAVRE
jgi:hypothetical protein